VEILFFKPQTINDDDDNGGRIIAAPVVSEFMPNIPQSEIDTGSVHYRKLFIIPEVEIPFLKIYALPTDAGDILQLVQGTDDDTQADAELYAGWKGTGTLKTGLSAGVITTLSVQSETAGAGYNALDLLRISDGINEEFVRVLSVSWSGKTATITLMGDTFIGNDYAVGSIVSACVERGLIGINSVWIKETVPKDLSFKTSNTLTIGVSL
jgi:hypothetical protein